MSNNRLSSFLSYHWTKAMAVCLILLMNLASFCKQVEAKKPRVVSAATKKNANIDHKKGVKFVVIIFLVAVIPTLIIFIWSVIKDPETPVVATKLANSAKENFLGYLSSVKKKVKSSSA